MIQIGEAAEQVVVGLEAELDRRRAEILDAAADDMERLAKENRRIARQLRERTKCA